VHTPSLDNRRGGRATAGAQRRRTQGACV